MPNHSKKMLSSLFLIMCMTLFFSTAINQVQAQSNEVIIYYFWGDGCPYCEIAKPVLEEMAESDPRIKFEPFEVYYHPENQDLFFEFATAYGFEPRAVPTILVGERYWEGFSDNIKMEIQSYIDTCLTQGCRDIGKTVLSGEEESPTNTPQAITPTEVQPTPVEITPTPIAETPAPEDTDIDPEPVQDETEVWTVSLPIIGTIGLSGQSLLASTMLIFGIALGLTAMILVIYRLVIPKFREHNGSDDGL